MIYKRYREESEAARMVCILFHKCCCMIQTENVLETDTVMFAGRGRESIETTEKDAGTPCKASASF